MRLLTDGDKPEGHKMSSITINGHTLERRVADMVGEINASHNVATIVNHHLGVVYQIYAEQADEIKHLNSRVKTLQGIVDKQNELIARIQWPNKAENAMDDKRQAEIEQAITDGRLAELEARLDHMDAVCASDDASGTDSPTKQPEQFIPSKRLADELTLK